MGYFVYILRCIDNSLYTGITWNLKKRITEHNSGLSYWTKSRIPVELVYWERFFSRQDAAKREKEIKGWTRVKKQALIESLR